MLLNKNEKLNFISQKLSRMECVLVFHRKMILIILLLAVMTISTSSSTDYSFNIAIISDVWKKHAGCSETCTELINQQSDHQKATVNVTWIYTNDPFHSIVTGIELLKQPTDIILVSSSHLVYNTIRQKQKGNITQIIHWPVEVILERNINREFHGRLCHCSTPKDPLSKCLGLQNDFSGTGNEKRNEIFAKLIQSLQEENLFVIFENVKGSGSAFSAKDLDGILLKPVIYYFERKEDINFEQIQKTLTDVRESTAGSMQLILICHEPCLKTLLSQAKQYYTSVGWQHYDQQMFRWLIFAQIEMKNAIMENTSDVDNVAFVSLTSDKHQSFTDHYGLVKLLIEASLFHTCCLQNADVEKSREILATYLTIYRDYLLKASMEYVAETLVWANDNTREFKSVGAISANGTYKAINKRDLFPNVAYGFNNRMFKVGTIEWPPFVRRDNDSGEIKYEGYCFEWLDELSRTLNFSYEVVYSPDDQWGMEANGTWTGLVGLLQRREVDLVVASLTINGDRETVMDFTYPFFYEDFAGVIAREDPNKRKWRSLIDPFSTEVILTAIGSLPVAAMALFLFEKYSPRLFRIHDKKPEGLHAFFSSFWYIYGALLLQGGVHEPMSFTGRTMLTSIWLYSIILAALYSGNLMASFTVPKYDVPIKKLGELVNQTDYKWGTMNGTIYVDMLARSKGTMFKKLWAGIERVQEEDPQVLSGDHEVHMKKMKSENYVYLAEITRFEKDQENDTNCTLVKFEDKIDNYPYGVGLQNRSSFLSTFSERIMQISESGLPASWKRKWWPKKLPCSDGTINMRSIDLIDIQSAFYLIGIGIGLACLCLLAERAMFRYQKRTSEQKDSGLH